MATPTRRQTAWEGPECSSRACRRSAAGRSTSTPCHGRAGGAGGASNPDGGGGAGGVLMIAARTVALAGSSGRVSADGAHAVARGGRRRRRSSRRGHNDLAEARRPDPLGKRRGRRLTRRAGLHLLARLTPRRRFAFAWKQVSAVPGVDTLSSPREAILAAGPAYRSKRACRRRVQDVPRRKRCRSGVVGPPMVAPAARRLEGQRRGPCMEKEQRLPPVIWLETARGSERVMSAHSRRKRSVRLEGGHGAQDASRRGRLL